MWRLAIALFFNVLRLSTMDIISNRFCADMRPQSVVTIEQLLGMWYGVEVINHKLNEERIGIEYVDSCPIIHISEDHSPTTPPFYKGNIFYPYGINRGSTYQDNDNQYQQKTDYNNQNNQGMYGRGTYGTNNYGHSQPTQHSKTTGHRGGTYYQGHNYGNEEYPRKYAEDIKRLRLLWTDNGGHVEYNLRYNRSKPGFWISSGPQNGSMLEPQFNYFDGTIQVIKAVGNHLVLTFCHQLPDQQLFTIILSRIPKLTRHEISDVHDLLTTRALETHNIKRVCSENSASNFHTLSCFLLLSLIGTNLIRIFNFRMFRFRLSTC